MALIIAHTSKPLTVHITTVTLGADPNEADPMRVYGFHCCRCGFLVAQHSGLVMGIFPGLEPTQTPVLAQCRRCEAMYYFKSIVGK